MKFLNFDSVTTLECKFHFREYKIFCKSVTYKQQGRENKAVDEKR